MDGASKGEDLDIGSICEEALHFHFSHYVNVRGEKEVLIQDDGVFWARWTAHNVTCWIKLTIVALQGLGFCTLSTCNREERRRVTEKTWRR